MISLMKKYHLTVVYFYSAQQQAKYRFIFVRKEGSEATDLKSLI
jgi:hypothetical protein